MITAFDFIEGPEDPEEILTPYEELDEWNNGVDIAPPQVLFPERKFIREGYVEFNQALKRLLIKYENNPIFCEDLRSLGWKLTQVTERNVA